MELIEEKIKAKKAESKLGCSSRITERYRSKYLRSEPESFKDRRGGYYKKFLEIWKDADPGIAEVEDAKKRLAKLKSS